MKTTQVLNKANHPQHSRTSHGFAGKVRALWRGQEDAQELLIEKQTPWLSRHY